MIKPLGCPTIRNENKNISKSRFNIFGIWAYKMVACKKNVFLHQTLLTSRIRTETLPNQFGELSSWLCQSLCLIGGFSLQFCYLIFISEESFPSFQYDVNAIKNGEKKIENEFKKLGIFWWSIKITVQNVQNV